MKRFLIFGLLLTVALTGCNISINNPSNKGFYVAGWMTNDLANSMNVFKANTAVFNEINPVWYSVKTDGTISEHPFSSEVIISNAGMFGVKVVPTIQNFIKNIKKLTENETHLNSIVALVEKNGYAGIDIDYEEFNLGDKGAFTSFISKLGQQLRSKGKSLSVTVNPKTFSFQSANAKEQDWAAIAPAVDTLKIMVYDYHYRTGTPGSVCPESALKGNLDYAKSIPELKGKVIIGLPFFGYDWPKTGAGTSVFYNKAIQLIQKYNPQVMRGSNSDWKDSIEPNFTYKDGAIEHTVYYQDAQALRERMAIIQQYRDVVKGVTFWQLGDEDPKMWEVIRDYKK